MSTIVIAIIVLVVLVLLILFFTGGTGKIGEKIAAVFQGSTGGDDMASSIQFCKGYCEKAKLLTSDEEKSNSPFCQKSFLIDTDGDGEAQFVQASNPKKYYKYFCTSNPNTNAKDEAKKNYDTRSLNLNCPEIPDCG